MLWFRPKSAHFVRVERECRKKFRKNIGAMISNKKCPFCSGRERALKEIQKKYLRGVNHFTVFTVCQAKMVGPTLVVMCFFLELPSTGVSESVPVQGVGRVWYKLL